MLPRLFFVLSAMLCLVEPLRAELVPNDPYFLPYQWPLAKMHVPTAWDYSLGSPSVKIAILDTGIVFDTPELQGTAQSPPRYLAPLNGVDVGLPEPSASNVHGTWVASTIAMPINNGIGGAGTGNFSILPIRVTNSNGNPSDTWIEQGISLAAQNDCRVITISLSALSYGAINEYVGQVLAANQAAGKKDFLVFMSAGNSNKRKSLDDDQLNQAQATSLTDNIIFVGGTDEIDHRWVNPTDGSQGSDYGPFLDLAAPASNILVENGDSASVPYGLVNGTSLSAPFAASAAALAFSINPDLTAAQVQNLLFSTALNPDNMNPVTPFWDESYGWGRVDFGALAAAAHSTLVPEPSALTLAAPSLLLLLCRRSRKFAD